MFDWLPNSENGRLGRFGRPAEPSAPKGRRFDRLWRDSRFYLQNSEKEATLLSLGTCHKVSTTGGGGYYTLAKIFVKAPFEKE